VASSVTNPVTASFGGTSTYASSLQQVITRAVNIASLPLQQLQNEQLTTTDKVSAAQSLQSTLNSLNTYIQALSTTGGNVISTAVSDPSVVQANAAAGALPGTYTINVLDAGSNSSSMSSDGLPAVTDPSSQSISASTSFTLTSGTGTYTITPSGNNLSALAQAINSSGAGVQATIINVGAPSQPDYRLALQSTSLGPQNLQLNDGSNDLLSGLTTGGNALYTVNGQPPAGISTDSSTVTVAPGLTVSLLGTGSSTVSVALDASSISDALNSFVTGFNAAQAELQKSYGQNAGALSGDSTIFATSNALRQLASYSGSGTIQSLTDLGIEFTKTGTLTFDASKVSSMSASQLSDVMAFLGDSTSGFLASATNTMNGLLDPTTGLVTGEINSLDSLFQDQGTKIAAEQDSIDKLQTNLTNQMNAADALIASLQQQSTFLTALFSTMNANNFAGH
jgi:flagellar hook-associated protein 2